MKNIIFIAPPAAGKGTQSKYLKERYNYKHISTGDLLRREIENKTELGFEISKTINSGNLVPNNLVTKVLDKEIKEAKEPVVFDGYPRSIEQAKTLDEILKKYSLNIKAVIYLDVSKKEALKRTSSRLICNNCGKTYHKYNDQLKPKQDGICDNCLTKLSSRKDDTEKTFEKRYATFINETYPLIKYYQDKLYIIKDPKDPEETFKKVEEIIK